MEQWQEYAKKLKEVLSLELMPVAAALLEAPAESVPGKLRMCRAILDAARGKGSVVSEKNNSCFGGAWHLGFQKGDDASFEGILKKFVVEGEKLFCSYEALDRLMSRLHPVPDNRGRAFFLEPMEACPSCPQVVLFLANAEEACRLLSLAMFSSGEMPAIKLGGPTCRMAVVEPMLSGQINVSFFDYTSRKICKVEKSQLLVSVPYRAIPDMVTALQNCSAGSAKIEYPPEILKLRKKIS